MGFKLKLEWTKKKQKQLNASNCYEPLLMQGFLFQSHAMKKSHLQFFAYELWILYDGVSVIVFVKRYNKMFSEYASLFFFWHCLYGLQINFLSNWVGNLKKNWLWFFFYKIIRHQSLYREQMKVFLQIWFSYSKLRKELAKFHIFF